MLNHSPQFADYGNQFADYGNPWAGAGAGWEGGYQSSAFSNPHEDWTGPRGFKSYTDPAEFVGTYEKKIDRPQRPGHHFEDRPDGRTDLPPTEVIIHPVDMQLPEPREVDVIVDPPELRPVIGIQERIIPRTQMPLEVEVERRTHIRGAKGGWTSSPPTFEQYDAETYHSPHHGRNHSHHHGHHHGHHHSHHPHSHSHSHHHSHSGLHLPGHHSGHHDGRGHHAHGGAY